MVIFVSVRFSYNMYVRADILLCIQSILVLQKIDCYGTKKTNRVFDLPLDLYMKRSKHVWINSKQNDHFCNSNIGIPTNNANTREQHSNLYQNGDTITQNDIVRSQYELLPYPTVTKERIEALRKHYGDEDKRDNPFARVPGSDLETINHYLFKGTNDFRWVVKSLLDI